LVIFVFISQVIISKIDHAFYLLLPVSWHGFLYYFQNEILILRPMQSLWWQLMITC
jgi:hypothetical protein